MYPPCVVVTTKLIPEIRKRVARILVSKGYSQSYIAKVFHISQPMVNKYLNAKTDNKYFKEDILAFSEFIADKIINQFSEADITGYLCEFCMSIRESGRFCAIHYIRECKQCFNFRNLTVLTEKQEVIDTLKKAVFMLESKDVTSITPKVRMNIAYALSNAKSKASIAAIPGKLVEIKGRLKIWSEPEFGASTHLSQLLLSKLKKSNDRAVMNIKFDNNIMRKLRILNFKIEMIDRTKVSVIENYPETVNTDFDILIDPGTFGIEPVTYVFGKDPIDVVQKVISIIETNR